MTTPDIQHHSKRAVCVVTGCRLDATAGEHCSMHATVIELGMDPDELERVAYAAGITSTKLVREAIKRAIARTDKRTKAE
jgi:hypothetical protein